MSRMGAFIAARLIAWGESRRPDFVIRRETGAAYLERHYIIPRNPVFNIYLHRVLRDDDDRALHDHPWVNASILLRGGYFEVLADGSRVWRGPGSVVLRRPRALHRLVLPSILEAAQLGETADPGLACWCAAVRRLKGESLPALKDYIAHLTIWREQCAVTGTSPLTRRVGSYLRVNPTLVLQNRMARRLAEAEARYGIPPVRPDLNQRQTCWSLFITGPRVRSWGFACPHGWVDWRVFTDPKDTGTIGRGCD